MAKRVDTSKIEGFLRDLWAFELIEPPQVHLLAKLVTVRRLRAKEILWLQGQRVTHFTIVYSGQLRSVRRSSSGGEKLVSILPAGHHFGLAEMVTEAASAVTLIAAEPTTILTMAHRPLRRLLLSHADICYRLMQTMARAIFSLTRDLERVTFENTHTRIARLLLKKSSGWVGPLPVKNFAKKTTHADLALQIGVSRETISRVLADFRQKGLIETAYRSITVLDRDRLMTYVDDYDQW